MFIGRLKNYKEISSGSTVNTDTSFSGKTVAYKSYCLEKETAFRRRGNNQIVLRVATLIGGGDAFDKHNKTIIQLALNQ